MWSPAQHEHHPGATCARSDTRPGACGLGRHTFPCSPPRPMHLRRRVIMAMTSIAVVRWAPLPPPERRSCPFDKLFLAHGNPCTSIIAPLPRHQRIMAPVMMGSSSLLELHRALLCIRVAHAHWRAAPSSDSVPDVSCFHLWPHGYASATATSSSLRNWETGSVSEGARSGGGPPRFSPRFSPRLPQ